jgi:polyhydroxybutyrate depolymerase
VRTSALAALLTAATLFALACASEPAAAPPSEAATSASHAGEAATDAGATRPAAPRPASGCSGALASDGGTELLTVAGPDASIEARIHLPAGYGDLDPLPLVLLFHGGGSNPDAILRSSQLAATADTHGFILVAPPNGPAASIEAVLGHVQATWCVDAARVYATGLSAGARIASRLACDLPGRIAAVAPVAGVQWPAIPCIESPPVPLIAAHGTDDRILAFGPALADVERWASHNGCSDRTSEQLGSIARIDRYEACEQGAEVALLVVEGGGHAWFGSPSTRAPDPVPGGTNALLWAFLSRFTLAEPAE